MRIGIDISQTVYEGTGVGKYVKEMVREILKRDKSNTYVLFGASLRKRHKLYEFFNALTDPQRVILRVFPIPPTVLDLLWNTLHIVPIEWFIGKVDVFWSSDWTQPPLQYATGVTTVHDLSILRFPESFPEKILDVQKRRLKWAKKECSAFLCDSGASKKDLMDFMHINENRIDIVYPGFSV